MKKKKVAVVISAIFLAVQILTFSVFAGVIPEPTSDFFVNDYADILTENDRENMQLQGEKLYKACGAQVVVVTVNDMGGDSLEDYSLTLARSWGIGSEENDDGVLLLLSVSERQVRIEVGEGLEGALPDSKTGRILDIYGMDDFKNDRFSAGLASVYEVLINEVRAEKGLDYDEDLVGDYDDVSSESFAANAGKAMVIIFIIAIMFWVALKILSYNDNDNTNTNHRDGSPYYRGSFHGGSFSSGRSSGGGGFSGGGGGFGGGGASRGF